MGIGAESRVRDEERSGDNPFVSLLLLLAFLTFCFIMSIPVLLLIRLLQ